jgi:hypothetical protein
MRARQFPTHDSQGIHFNQGFLISIDGMKMWRIVVVVIHLDDDPEKATEFRHSHLRDPYRRHGRIPLPAMRNHPAHGDIVNSERVGEVLRFEVSKTVLRFED